MTSTTSTTNTQAAALRAAAEFIEAHPELPAPYITSHHRGRVELNYFLNIGGLDAREQRTAAEAVIATVNATWIRNDRTDGEVGFRCTQEPLGFHVIVSSDAEYTKVRVAHNPILTDKAVSA